MKNAYYRITLDVHDVCSQVTLTARRGETGRTILATLTENGRPYEIADGCSAEFVCIKSNGSMLKNECVIEGNMIRYDLTQYTTMSVGVLECELRLTDAGGALLCTPRFRLEVHPTIYTPGDAIESEVANLNTVKSANPAYAEVFMWSDGNPEGEDRVGYFVTNDTDLAASMVKKCSRETNILGVTMTAPGFASNAPGERYENGRLRKQFTYVGLMGFAPVIDNGSCAVNGRCRPGDDGTAVPDDSGGYLVLERMDESHVLILLEQTADVMLRVGRQMEQRLEKIKKTFTATIGTEWAGTESPYTQTIAVVGILEKDNPNVDLLPDDGIIQTDEEEEAFGLIRRIKTNDGSITVYAREKTVTPITIQMEEHRLDGDGDQGDHEAALIPGNGAVF